ncbi:hypothetical protein P175DRAFT_0507278 [Aspergillus ochraceoroseus IBT 24754]|nr:uncharacterized protein P175DRAFT_0507278 [Aspergillus ochraceoroseus IBT 24754]PTU22433.1 hypothetical protein P175DRAFT_0507278 [Aspergillus ochraceoroseus IBT 24754]
MNRYRNAPGVRGPSKATASTLCQKCLKRDIYECKVSAQERPYMARPSRTQQLQNPKLRPQLSTEVPSDPSRTKGVADGILTKREEERGRKRELDELDPRADRDHAPKRTRSTSSHSVSSVSTISTGRSRSESPRRERPTERPRSNRANSQSSPHSWSRKRRHSDSSSDYSVSSYSSEQKARSRSPEWTGGRNTRRRRRESSPKERGRSRNVSHHEDRGNRSRSRGVDKGRIARERRSMTPAEAVAESNHQRRISPRAQPRGSYNDRGRDERNHPPPPRRERSLSPYSKRLALTQAMNMGG